MHLFRPQQPSQAEHVTQAGGQTGKQNGAVPVQLQLVSADGILLQ